MGALNPLTDRPKKSLVAKIAYGGMTLLAVSVFALIISSCIYAVVWIWRAIL